MGIPYPLIAFNQSSLVVLLKTHISRIGPSPLVLTIGSHHWSSPLVLTIGPRRYMRPIKKVFRKLIFKTNRRSISPTFGSLHNIFKSVAGKSILEMAQ